MQFPFKIKPQENFINLGDEVNGSIEIAVYNDLTIAEQLEYDQAVALLGSETQPVVDLILKVAKDEQLTFEKAQKVIFGADIDLPPGKDVAAIRLKYSNSLLELNAKLLPIQQNKQLIGATIMIRRAIAPLKAYVKQLENAKAPDSSLISEYQEQIRALEVWSVEDTKACKELRQGTLKALYEFFLKESNGGVTPQVDATGATDTQSIQDAGKPIVVDVEAAAVTPETSGVISSGEPGTTGLTIPDLLTKTSLSVPEA